MGGYDDPFAQEEPPEPVSFDERADRWAMFAIAGLAHGTPAHAAAEADELLALYDERFPYVAPPVGGATTSPVPGAAGDA